MRFGRLNFGEAAVVGGDNLVDVLLRQNARCPQVIANPDEQGRSSEVCIILSGG